MQTRRPVVLLVEDDPAIGTLVSRRLQERYELVVATNDRAALAHLRTLGDKIHAVLMDLQLIGSTLDGLALIRLIRGKLPPDQTPDYARGIAALPVPVFIVSADPDAVTEDQKKELAIDGAMPKPIDFRFLALCLAQASIHHAVAHLEPAGSRKGVAR